MAKSKKPKKSVTKKPSKQDLKQKKINEEYAHERKLLLQNIRRLEARGYDVSAITIPEIPKQKKKEHIKELKKINADRYKKATFEVEVIKNKGRKNERIEVAKVKGTKYVKQENKIRAEKAAATRRENKKLKEEKTKITDYGIGKITVRPIGDDVEDDIEFRDAIIGGTGSGETKSKGGYGSELDNVQLGTWFNPETGEIREGKKPRYGTWYNEIEAREWYDQNIYQNVIKKVENMQIYEGKTKRSMQIRSNADRIRNKIEEEYKKNPKNVTRVLSEMETIGALNDIEMWYFAQGYNKFEYNFMMYLGLFDEDGVINDEEEYTDYDE